MPIYRKRPVEIEAVQYNGENGNVLRHWGAGTIREIPGTDPFPLHLEIETLEGTMTAQIGDWIIKGVAGEFYPCKPDIFEATYEETIPF